MIVARELKLKDVNSKIINFVNVNVHRPLLIAMQIWQRWWSRTEGVRGREIKEFKTKGFSLSATTEKNVTRTEKQAEVIENPNWCGRHPNKEEDICIIYILRIILLMSKLLCLYGYKVYFICCSAAMWSSTDTVMESLWWKSQTTKW